MTLRSLICTSSKVFQPALTLQSTPELWDCFYQHDESAKITSRVFTTTFSDMKGAARRNSIYPFQTDPIAPVPEMPAQGKKPYVWIRPLMGKAGIAMTATTEHNKNMSSFCSSEDSQMVMLFHPSGKSVFAKRQ